MLTRIKQEIREAIPEIIFFVIGLNLINFTEGLMLKQYDLTYLSVVTVTIGAIIVSKFFIIINLFPFINAFPDKPLIYNIVWKSSVYGILMLFFHVLDHAVRLSMLFGVANISDYLIDLLKSPAFWSIQLWLQMLLTIYVIANEFVHAIGRDTVRKLLWG